MARTDFERALQGAREIQLTVTGRISGRQITQPIWFVLEDGRLYLLPVRGSDADWFRNLVKNPTVRLAVDGAERTVTATPITDQAGADRVVDKFRAKYGARDVQAYYTKTDVAVEVPLA